MPAKYKQGKAFSARYTKAEAKSACEAAGKTLGRNKQGFHCRQRGNTTAPAKEINTTRGKVYESDRGARYVWATSKNTGKKYKKYIKRRDSQVF